MLRPSRLVLLTPSFWLPRGIDGAGPLGRRVNNDRHQLARQWSFGLFCYFERLKTLVINKLGHNVLMMHYDIRRNQRRGNLLAIVPVKEPFGFRADFVPFLLGERNVPVVLRGKNCSTVGVKGDVSQLVTL